MSGRDQAALYSRAARTYDRVGPSPFTHFARRVVELAAIEPNAHILDVATEAGAMILAAGERVGGHATFVGIDLSDAMLERAREATEAARLSNVELRAM